MRRCVSRSCSLRSRAARATASLNASRIPGIEAAYPLGLLAAVGYCVGIGRTLAILEIADDCSINQTPDPAEDPSHCVHG